MEHMKNKLFKPFGVESVTASVKNRTFNRVLAIEPYHSNHKLFFPSKNPEAGVNGLDRVYSELAYQMMQFSVDGSKSPHDDLVVSLGLHMDYIVPGGEVKKEGPPFSSAAWKI